MTELSAYTRAVLATLSEHQDMVRAWRIPDDPFAAEVRRMAAWMNPFMPPQEGDPARVWGFSWESLWETPPLAGQTLRPEFTDEDWVAWLDRPDRWPTLQWPRARPWSVLGWTLTLWEWLHGGRYAEQRAALAESARGRIMGTVSIGPGGSLYEFGGSHGLRFMRVAQNPAPSAFHGRHRTHLSQRGRSKSRSG